jgi:sulfide:quinone oxidoreductase
VLSYDSLIIALGAEQHGIAGHSLAFNPYSLADAAELHKVLGEFRQGHIVVFVSSLPFTGAIAPYEIALLLNAYFRRRGLRKNIQISLITPEARLFSFASPHYSQKLTAMLQDKGIQVITNREMSSLSPRGVDELSDSDIPADLFIGIPQHKGPAPFRDSIIANAEGWLTVDPNTLATCVDDVYAVGDATAIESPAGTGIPKVGFFAHYQAEVVARNLALQYDRKPQRFSFVGGAAGASMLASLNEGCFVSVKAYASPPVLRLSRPNPMAYWTKMLFERYWLRSWF